MKKMASLIVLSVGVITLFSFMVYSNSELSKSDSEFSLSDHMHKVVYKELNVLTGYNPQKSYSRCPSGFSYNEAEKSNDEVAYGTIYNAEGCHREPFCEFKIIIAERKTFLKKTTTDPFIAMSDFVKKEQGKSRKEVTNAKY